MKIVVPLSLLLLMCFGNAAFAQNSDSLEIKRYYEKNTIFWPGGKKYSKNDQYFPFKKIKQEFEFSKEASLEYDLAQSDGRRSIATMILADVILLAALFINEPGPSLALVVGSGITFGFSIKLSKRSLAHLQRSIWVHNRDVLLR